MVQLFENKKNTSIVLSENMRSGAMAVFRFLVAFLAFSLINHQIGYMDILKRVSDCTALCIIVFIFAFRHDAVFRCTAHIAELLCTVTGVMRYCGIDLCGSFCIYYRFTSKRHLYGTDFSTWNCRYSLCNAGGGRNS